MHTQPLRLIGLTGYAGSGKDTVRNMLEDDHGFVGLAFADPIRTMLRALFDGAGINTDHMDLRELKEQNIEGLGVSYRQLAQTLGTEWGRVCVGRGFWLRIAHETIQKHRRHGERLFVVSDVRFENEARWIQDAGGEVWRIDRPGTDPVRPHVSENNIATLPANRIISNAGTVEDLWCVVSSLMRTEATS